MSVQLCIGTYLHIPVVHMYSIPKNGTYAGVGRNREIHNEAWILYTMWLKFVESFESLFEYFHFFWILVTLYKKIRKSQEILGNQDSANPWIFSESIKIFRISYTVSSHCRPLRGIHINEFVKYTFILTVYRVQTRLTVTAWNSSLKIAYLHTVCI